MNRKILVADDEPGILDFITIYFKAKGYTVITARDGGEVLTKLSLKPDLILLDIMMPKLDGLEVCQRIREHVACPILFLTAKTEEKDRIKGLTAGGDDYIIKPFSAEELLARVEAHLRREERKKKNPAVYFYEEFWIDYDAHKAGVLADEVSLTKKEYEIISLLSMNREQVFSKEHIYEIVWGYDAQGDAEVAVTEHVKRIRKKFEGFGVKVIDTIWGVGYRWNL